MVILVGEDFYQVPDVDWWLEGIIPKGQVCAVWGDADAGKSCLATDWFGCLLIPNPQGML